MVTRNGLAVLILAASGFVLGRLFGLVELYVLGAGLVLLVVAAVAVVALRPVRVTVARTTIPARPSVGDAAEVHLAFTADRRSPVIDLWEPVGDDNGASMRLAPLRPHDAPTTVTYVLPTHRRGALRVGPLSAEASDPFGLARRRRWLAPPRDVIVRPRTLDLALPDPRHRRGPLARRLAVRALATTSADEFRSLREYVPGDDLRRVHWGATARRGELLVREADPGTSVELVVVLDLDAASYDGADAFELAVSAAASLASSAVVTGRPLSLHTSDGEELLVDPTRIDATLDRLALITTASARIAPNVRRSTAALVVSTVITGTRGTDRARRLGASNGPADASVVVACGTGATTTSRSSFLLTPSDHHELAVGWNRLVEGSR